MELGVRNPWGQMYGCDVASAAFSKYLAKLIPSEANRANFVKGDFLGLTPHDFGAQVFQAALGNPPYVSYHNMFKVQRAAAAKVGFDQDFRVPQTGNLWSYFVFHSIRFLAQGGRMAWLLPTSLLQAEYGRTILNEVGRRFARVAVISLKETVFDGTNERSEVLLCDSLGSTKHAHVEIANAKSLIECGELLRKWDKQARGFIPLERRSLISLVPRYRLAAFKRLAGTVQSVRLRELARLSIGMVTGANDLFIVSHKTAAHHQLSDSVLKPILAKFEIAPGLSIHNSDFRRARRKEQRSFLVDASVSSEAGPLKKYFDRMPPKQREKNVTFGKRKNWRIPDEGSIPDAFMPYMHHTGPRVVLNRCQTNSTNTIHRLYFNRNVTTAQRELLAISMLSTFSQLSAEIEGRSYGSGVLKHELREAGSIQLLVPNNVSAFNIAQTFKNIDASLRAGDTPFAQKLADRFLLSCMPESISELSLTELENDLRFLRRRRHSKQKK